MIAVENLCVRAGSFALEGISFVVPTGRYCVLMGRTGCGKTTLLEAICGLKPVAAGHILLGSRGSRDSRDVVGLRPADRGIGFVPQDAALFSTKTVRDHLAFSLEVRGRPRAEVEARVRELAELLGIARLLERRPEGLSGGEKQRVALGRALSFHPDVLCLDEPLTALDEATKGEICELLRDVRARTGVTALHITHNLSEARALADLLLVFEDGKVVERPLDGIGNRRPSDVSSAEAL
jgi:ABC-type sugar transport system ATPase subunit